MRFIVPLLIACCVAAEDLPPELQHLNDLNSNEKALVDAVRKFDLLQVELINRDLEIIRGYSRSTQQDLIEAKYAEAGHRQALIGTAWKYTFSYYPKNARANNYYGEYLYDQVAKPLEAVIYWKKSALYDTKLANPHNNLGIHYFHNGQYVMGNDHLQRALKLDPDNPDYNFNMAQIYLNHFPQMEKILDRSRNRLFKDAMRYSKKAAQLVPDEFEFQQDYAVNFYAGENLDVKVDWNDAARAWQKVIPLSRTEDERFFAHLNEGRTWSRAGRHKDAAAAFRAALQIKPDSDKTSELLAQAEKALN